jgi:carboxylesterase
MSDPTSGAPRTDGAPDAEVLPGAEPMSVAGGPVGALVIHGFTSTPQSVRGLAQAFADAGFTVELPRLPGHGTSLDDALTSGWDDWSNAAEAAYQDLASRCDRVVVAGLSMGATLALWLAAQHPEIDGIVLVNPLCPPPGSAAENLAGLQALADADVLAFDALSNDIAEPGQTELAYEQTPVEPLSSLLANAEELAGRLDSVRCPVLLMNSPQDHVVPPEHSEHVAASVATLDHDRDLINERALAFARRVTGD